MEGLGLRLSREEVNMLYIYISGFRFRPSTEEGNRFHRDCSPLFPAKTQVKLDQEALRV